jgi:hypothetical protein
LSLDLFIGAMLRAFVIACGACAFFALTPRMRLRFVSVFVGALIGGYVCALELNRFF